MITFAVILEVVMTLIVYGAYIMFFAFTLWMVVDAGKQDRFWWMVLIIGIPFIGSGVYFFTEKKHEYAKAEPHHVHDSETEQQHESAPHKHHAHKHTSKKDDESDVNQITVENTKEREEKKDEQS